MKYTVVYKPLAELQLADIWLRFADKQAATEASDAIERSLRHNADQIGEPDERGWRILAEPPLVVTFDVSVDDRRVIVHSVRLRP